MCNIGRRGNKEIKGFSNGTITVFRGDEILLYKEYMVRAVKVTVVYEGRNGKYGVRFESGKLKEMKLRKKEWEVVVRKRGEFVA